MQDSGSYYVGCCWILIRDKAEILRCQEATNDNVVRHTTYTCTRVKADNQILRANKPVYFTFLYVAKCFLLSLYSFYYHNNNNHQNQQIPYFKAHI
jgi:hypothetical protein